MSDIKKNEAERILKKYPDRIPIIIKKMEGSDIPNVDKNKYLVPMDLTFSQFMYVIRKRIKLKPEKALFLFVNNSIPTGSKMISEIYKTEKDETGFLYVEYSGENTFG